jgi:hypothetical protein
VKKLVMLLVILALPVAKTMPEAATSSESVTYKFNSTDHSRGQFVSDNYVDCLAEQ